MMIDPKAFMKDKRKGLILFFIIALLLIWFFFLGGDEVINDLSTGTLPGGSGNGNGDPATTDPPAADIDDPVADMNEVVICILHDSDRLNPGESYSKSYSVANAESMSCSIERYVINTGVGTFRWTFYDNAGSIWTKTDTTDSDNYGNPIIKYNVDSGTWQVALENHFDTLVTFSYTITVYGYT